MSNPENETELLARISQLESSLSKRVSQLEERLEEALMLFPDTYRYGKLRDLLAAGKWKEADLETTKIMIEITGKDRQEEVTPADIQIFPCSAIRVIDRLWTKYSNNHFGFTVQLSLYQSLGGSIDTIRSQSNEFLARTSNTIGWRKNDKLIEYDDFDFSLSAPEGGLPGNWWRSPYGAKMANFFLARLLACGL
ncbi:hypothetical protein STA3757_27080 [Stanieria sp. NIES-3757]|nr:hypothetical protein STA3757_27080 [Stanieria sp. NIES-3757]